MALFKTDGPVDVAVKFNYRPASGPLMQTINVLGNQGKFWKVFFQINQSQMAGIRFGLGNQFPPPGIPLPNQPGVAPEGLGGG